MNWPGVDGGYARDGAGYWKRPDASPFSYTDGSAVEERIARAIGACADRSVLSMELRTHITDWPSRYHLSPVRSNLLRPIEKAIAGASVLEIGAGCGALSRFIGEAGAASLVALEGSPQRAISAALRCADLPRVHVVADTLQEFRCNERFDIVTLIGVLEYARIHFRVCVEGDPVDHMLAAARKLLKPGGLLVLAIENQLGLKYFCGYREDHVAAPYFGIEDAYDDTGVVTFGRRELSRSVVRAGLAQQRWLFPFPDYKLPCAVLDEAATSDPDRCDLSAILQGSVLADPQAPPRNMVSLEQAWSPVFRNGLAGELANSFLLLASDVAATCELPPRFLAQVYSVERQPVFAKRTTLEQVDDSIRVRSESLVNSAGPRCVPGLEQRLGDSDYRRGRLWHSALIAIVTREGWTADSLVQWFAVWKQALPPPSSGRAEADWTLPAECWDAVPRNLVVGPDGAHFIDLEWSRSVPLRFSMLMYRACVLSLLAIRSVARPSDTKLLDMNWLLPEMFRLHGLDAAPEKLALLHEEEQAFQRAANGSDWISFEAVMAYRLPEVEPRQ